MKAKLYACPCGKVKCRAGWKHPKINWAKVAEYLKQARNITVEIIAVACPDCAVPAPSISSNPA